MEKKKLEELLKDFTAENLNQKYPLTEEEFKAVVILKRKDLFVPWLEFNKLTLKEQLFLIEPENDEMFALTDEKFDAEAEIAMMKYNHQAVFTYLLKNKVCSEALDALVGGDNVNLFLFMVQEYPYYEDIHQALMRNPEHKMHKRMRIRNMVFISMEKELIEGDDLESFEIQCQYLGLSNTSQKLLVAKNDTEKFLIYIKYRELTCHEAQIALVEAGDERLTAYLRQYGGESLCEVAQILLA